MKKMLFALMAAVCVMLTGCSSDDGENKSLEPSPYKPIELNSETRAAADAGNDFAFRLFDRISSANSDKNVACSPLSAFMTMAMMANGDNGETRDELLRVLGYKTGPEGVDELNRYCSLMIEELPCLDRATEVKLANSVWLIDRLQFKEAFSRQLVDYYNAETVSFTNSKQGSDLVNEWVKKESHGLIESIIDGDDMSNLVLANVAYFKGIWNEPFDSRLTVNGEFRNSDGSVSDVRFMNGERMGSYVESGNLYGVALSFGNGNYEMTLLRNEEGSVPELNRSDWNDLDNPGMYYVSSLRMPKFISEYDDNIIGYLQTMGLSRALDYRFGFDNMAVSKSDGADNKMSINYIKHGVKVIVDEQGAEAAGVTVAGFSGGIGLTNPKEVNFDVPFVYVISETSTGAILFMGRIQKMD